MLRTVRLRAALLLALLVYIEAVNAASMIIQPSHTQAQVAAAIAQLGPGDTLTVTPGTYTGIDLDLANSVGGSVGIAGTAGNPIIITGQVSGNVRPLLQADTAGFQENIRIRPGCAHIVINNLHLQHISGGTQTTQAGILFDSDVTDITISNMEIDSVTGIGIQAQTATNVSYISITNNFIHNTGTRYTDGNNGGQGITFGLFSDTVGQEGYCLGLFYNVIQSQVLDNVMYNCPRGRSTSQAQLYGVAVYSGPSAFNYVQRNLIYSSWQASPHNNVALYVGSGTIVDNNLIVYANLGIALRRETATDFNNTRIAYNTVYTVDGAGTPSCGTAPCYNTYAFSQDPGATSTTEGPDFVVANNFFSCGANDGTAMGYRWAGAVPPNAIIRNNYFTCQDPGDLSSGFTKLTGAASTYLSSPSTTIPGADFLPQGSILGAAFALNAPTDDFDGNPRPASGADVGCYEASAGTHWSLALQQKPYAGGATQIPIQTTTTGSPSGSTTNAVMLYTPGIALLAISLSISVFA